MPLVHWFRKELKENLLAVILEPRTLQRGYFKPAAVKQLVDEHLRGRRDRTSDLSILLIFELWHRNFVDASSWPAAGARSLPTTIHA
jgi:asparagine synthase (glutamine-hydrolysing)